jgi:hypothetical protein
MSKLVKIRLGYERELKEFPDRNAAFEWIRETQTGRTTIAVLTYEHSTLEDLTRWHFNGQYFKKEDITN